jgi:hypothetical protein
LIGGAHTRDRRKIREAHRCKRDKTRVSSLVVYPTTRITVEIDPGAVPIGGWLQSGPGSRLEFHGMLELLSLLEAARQQAASNDGVGGRSQDAERR